VFPPGFMSGMYLCVSIFHFESFVYHTIAFSESFAHGGSSARGGRQFGCGSFAALNPGPRFTGTAVNGGRRAHDAS
jgi:hypothetical protein